MSSLISRCNPNFDDIFSFHLPLIVVMSLLQQSLDFAIKSPMNATDKGFFALHTQHLAQYFL